MHNNIRKLVLTIFAPFRQNEVIYCQVTEADYYNVLNQIIEINNVTILSKNGKAIKRQVLYQDKFIEWCIEAGNNKINLKQIDSPFIEKQINGPKVLRWDKNKITKAIKIRRYSIDYFTIPLFLNQEKDLVMVFHSAVYGRLAGEGNYELYQKQGKQWKLINHKPLWIS